MRWARGQSPDLKRSVAMDAVLERAAVGRPPRLPFQKGADFPGGGAMAKAWLIAENIW